jgi:hypothetical protein
METDTGRRNLRSCVKRAWYQHYAGGFMHDRSQTCMVSCTWECPECVPCPVLTVATDRWSTARHILSMATSTTCKLPCVHHNNSVHKWIKWTYTMAWAEKNPAHYIIARHQHQFSNNVWSGLLGDHTIGPHVFPPCLSGATYLQLLQTKFLQLVYDIPLATCASSWFMHDRVPANFRHKDSHTSGIDVEDPWHGQHVHLT